MLSNYDERSGFVRLPPVHIESPEQFVPLFVAYDSPFKDYLPWTARYKLHWHHGSSRCLTKAEFKAELLSMFNLSYPDHYSIPVPLSKVMFNNGGGDNTEMATAAFTGSAVNIASHQGHNYFVLPGLIMNTHRSVPDTYALLKTSEYPESGTMVHMTNFANCFNPNLLIVVKAKHIPMIRAAQHLKVPFKLPLNGAKVFTFGQHGSMLIARITRNLLDPLISQQGLVHEYLEMSQMRSYVIGEKPVLTGVNVSKILDRALELQTEFCTG
jgi:hypothetical protein